ncbi:glutamine-dependent NAD(+) synthetase [Elasticomyces elasticus]|nr:glutamine-dependent NAD(+) synthetase [Elasticomyces elasticus]
MGRLATLATCQLDQWCLDWRGNTERIIRSIQKAKEAGARFRTGPELEITAYGLLDHYGEQDTFDHSWELCAEILNHSDCQDILLDIGMPVKHRGLPFNCRVIALNGKVLGIRPKLWLCNDGNYREMRYFTPWKQRLVEDFVLPDAVQKLKGQKKTRFGDLIYQFNDGTRFAAETCEELWTPQSPHEDYSLLGVDIIVNASGSHHELRKLDKRVNLMLEATSKCGGVYLYANQQGCDGDRLYYDGCAMIMYNGNLLAQGTQFSLNDVEVLTVTVDLDDVQAFRNSRSRGLQAMDIAPYEVVEVDFDIYRLTESDPTARITPQREIRYHKPEEEIALGPACWLWDYLRRSKTAGYALPLSGGIDSCATATIVHSMCRLVVDAVKQGNEQVIADAKRICGEDEDWIKAATPQDIAGKMFVTVYMGMKSQSSKDTRKRAADLAKAIGSYHIDCNIDILFDAFSTLLGTILNFRPKFKVHGGREAENICLQNLQSRSRMVLIYAIAQIMPTVRGRNGGLLVLGSANVDESLRGYLTKYDASSADLNPIGGISKTDLRAFILWARDNFDIPVLAEFYDAVPTAELEPITETYVQSDEADMGMTYEELSVFGRLRKVSKYGMYSMWQRLVADWSDKYTPRQVYEKVKRFHFYYAINRHKMTTITPAYHAEQYSPDDNRYDMRPFLIESSFSWVSAKIEKMLGVMEDKKAEATGGQLETADQRNGEKA